MGNTTEKIPGGEIEVVRPGALGTIASANLPEPVRRFLAEAAEGADISDEDAELAILTRILMAEDLSGILSDAQVAHAKDYLNAEVVIYDYHWQQSDFQGGVGAYMVLDAAEDYDRDRFPMTCGSKTCMAQVWVLKQHGFLPVKVTVTQSEKPTKAGFFPMRFVLPEEPFAAE